MSNAPVYGCSDCEMTGGRMACPTHGQTVFAEDLMPDAPLTAEECAYMCQVIFKRAACEEAVKAARPEIERKAKVEALEWAIGRVADMDLYTPMDQAIVNSHLRAEIDRLDLPGDREGAGEGDA